MTPVSLHVWRIPAAAGPAALWRVARDRSRLRRTPGVRFAKILGTSPDFSFGPGRVDLTRWAAVIVWDRPDGDSAADARAAGWEAGTFDASPVGRVWAALADRRCRIDLSPVATRGRWTGQQPFTPGRAPPPDRFSP